MSDSEILRTPLHALHVELGARIAPFAGYDMPIHYAWDPRRTPPYARPRAGLFDVSHMGQARSTGPIMRPSPRALERCAPPTFRARAGTPALQPVSQRRRRLIDDLMVSRPPGADGRLNLVVNAARKAVDFALLEDLPVLRLTPLDRALIACRARPQRRCSRGSAGQGRGDAVHERHGRRLAFGVVSRSGYTGETASRFRCPPARPRLSRAGCSPKPRSRRWPRRARFAAARGGALSLRPRARRDDRPDRGGPRLVDPKAAAARGGFPGAARVQAALAEGPARKRVGLRLEGRAPAREGAEIVDAAGAPDRPVTSGGFGPSVGAPIAMGYVAAPRRGWTAPRLVVRGKLLPARVAPLPFHPHAYSAADGRFEKERAMSEIASPRSTDCRVEGDVPASASAIMRRASSATSSVELPASATSSGKAPGRRWSRASSGERRFSAGSGEVVEVNRRSSMSPR